MKTSAGAAIMLFFTQDSHPIAIHGYFTLVIMKSLDLLLRCLES